MIRRRHITPLNEKGHNQELNCSAIFGRTIEGKNNKESHNIPNEKENEGGAFDDVNMSEDDEGGTRVGDIYIPPPVPPHCSTESKGARLIIKNIEVNNFKSFAGKVVLGPFHHRFTAIIGPNGSGKSNVIDSMLFVFGYRANRIRCKKISALLHKSSTYQNVTSCSVAVHFVQIVNEQDDTYEQVPNSDIVVQRTAFHDNSSFYTINGKRVQFKEVSSLLKEHSVDLDHNRFLILQGEVETIAEMKPKGQTELDCGMLEYLEDIIGTSRYKKPLMKINERVENLTEERTEKHNRCKLAERDMNDLEQPYNEAVEYLKQENENTRTKNLRIQKYLSETHKKLEKYIKDHEAIKEELSKHDAECEELKKQLEQYEKTIRKEMKHFENLQMKKEDIKNRMQMAKKGYAEVQQIMTKSNEVRKRNKNQLEKYEKELEELKKVPERNVKKIRDYEEATEHLEQQKVTLDEELEIAYKNFEEQTKPLIEKREGLENELIELTRCVDEAKSDLALTESELKFLTHETRKYESMKNAYEESQKTLQQHKLEKRKLEESLPAICKDIEQKTKDIEKLKLDKENMRTNLMTLKAEIHERTLSIQTTRSNNKVLDFIMQQKNEGKICGIIGRLGDLGAIDPKYDIAISSSCGRLDNILVETVDVAQKCIEHLKRYEVGRGCFIALDKVAHYGNESYPIRTPENVERLYDLVRVEDERVRPAFYFALRNTLIARDLEQARRIAYGEIRHRVVTLNGEVIETSGTMTGGGCIQIRGKMGSKVQVKSAKSSNTSCMSQKALENLQIKAEELQSAINFKEEEEGRLEKEIGQLTATAHQTECSLRKLIITINSLEEQLPEIFEQVEAQKERMQENKNVQNKVESLNCDIEKKKTTLLKAEEAANKMREKVTAVKNEIAAVHKTVKAVQVKIKNVEAKISETSNCIAQLKADINMSERNVSKKQSQIEQLQTSILNAQNKLKELSEARQKHDDDIGESTTELNKIEEEIQKAKSETSESYKGKQDIEKRKSDLNLKRVEIEHKLHTVVTKMQDVKTQIPHWQEELKPLKLNEIPGETEPPPPLKTYTEEELNTYTLQDLQYKESVQEELLKNKPNLSCIAEYTEKRDVYLERVKILEDITCKRNEMRQLYDDVRKKRYNEFMRGFHIITRKLKEMYQMITQGGDAELELVDSMDPFTEGVSFSVRPPKKTWKNISNLSGGEKTLSSLALVFALHYYKPSPLYFMDEIDAALDFKNISIVAHYIKQRTKNSQFIIISLRSNMFELSDYLVGIYKVNDCTDTCCIKNRKPVEAENNVITELMPTSQLPVQPQSQLRLQPQ